MVRLLLLLGLAAAVAAQDVAIRLVYHHAKRLTGEHRAKFAAERAAEYQGKAAGADLLYLAYLWSFAGETARAADTFAAYLREAGRAARNRPVAMFERVRALAQLGRWDEVPPQAAAFANEHPTHSLLGRMRFYVGRARRAQARLVEARREFEAAVRAGHDVARYEVADCLVQLGEYDLAGRALDGLDSTAARVLKAALPHLGKPWPRVEVGHWAGAAPAATAMFKQPTALVFWSMKSTQMRDRVHAAGNALAQRFAGKVLVIGPTTYEQFDPSRMRTDMEMSPREEEGFVTNWHKDYGLQYPLAMLDGDALHTRCGLDPLRPALPSFAVGDADGKLRYVRVGGSAWALEAVESMLRVVTSE